MAEQATYRWEITKDLISNGGDVGQQGPYNLDPELDTNKTPFRMYDDDDELYYEGNLYGEFDCFEPLDDFGMPNAGATSIKVKEKNGRWTVV